MQAMVRAIFRVAAIPGTCAPYDRVNLKVFYPAHYGDTAEVRRLRERVHYLGDVAAKDL